MTSTTPPRLGRRPGPKPRLSADLIVGAAIDVGLDTVTMRHVADRLGVTASSLYRYFESRDGIVLAALEHLLDRAPAPDAGAGWRAAMEAEAALQWDLFSQCPGLLASSPERVAVATNARTVRLVEVLVADGMTYAQAVLVVDTVTDIVHDGVGQASRLRAPRGDLAPGLAARMAACPEPVREALLQIVDDPAAHVNRRLHLVLDGVAAMLARDGQP